MATKLMQNDFARIEDGNILKFGTEGGTDYNEYLDTKPSFVALHISRYARGEQNFEYTIAHTSSLLVGLGGKPFTWKKNIVGHA